jgi:Zn-dependent protease with chaperone function
MLHEVTHAKSRSEMITELLIFVLNILISTFILRLVWNRSLSKHISILKPISSLLDAFILSISLQIVRGI